MTLTTDTVLETHLAGVKLFKRGKVRDVYDLGGHLLIVATDRISAFDVVIPTGIPRKGAVLTALSAFWFEKTKGIMPSHFVSSSIEEIVRRHPALESHRNLLAGRSMLVDKAEVVPIECVVRGYLSGSGWKEYQKNQAVCGISLPAGLTESQELPKPLFTPATKEESGHDINISEDEMARRVGQELTQQLKRASVAVYTLARDYARDLGLLLADTKFEFGRREGKILLVDEALTPDSSRFWPREGYAPGGPQASFDKQFVRDYLEQIRWDKNPPAPSLPEEIARRTSEKYMDALRKLTGRDLDH
jgi:phosphoribosylaminoimidazole-succinocarboxamide synthase